MGCTGSKQSPRDLRRSASVLRPNSVADHRVSLTSSTLGSLDPHHQPTDPEHPINKPRTPTHTPPNEPEHINAWELMAGLDDYNDISNSAAIDRRSFSFCTTTQPTTPKKRDADADADAEVVSTFRKAMEELSPQNPIILRSPERSLDSGFVRARIRAFQEKINAKKAGTGTAGGGGRVVVYFTSLRGVRKTYEDCCWVREVVREYGVRVDERDVSMDRGFREEVAELGGALPWVVADGRCLGGAEEMRRMHEGGGLGEAFGVELKCEGARRGPCEGCGDVRFVPCRRCLGSCKVYVEDEEVEDDAEEVAGGGFRQCPECNENGIVRCPVCC